MKRLIALIAVLVLTATAVFAHEGNDHVRGVVTKITPAENWLSVKTVANETRTLSLTDKTVFKQGKKTVTLAELKVGDRVVIDVPVKTAQATLIQIGDAAPAPAGK